MNMKEYKFKINGKGYDVAIDTMEGNVASVTVNGVAYQVELENTPAAESDAATPVMVQNPARPAAPAPAAAAEKAAAGAGKAVTSPLPGVVIAIKVNVGDVVKSGQEVAVLEAMKMENSIEATQDGTVTAVHVTKGDSIQEGTAIISIG
jgi:biotin carboxyl carrier protein